MNVTPMPRLQDLLTRIEALEMLVAQLIAAVQKSAPEQAANLRELTDVVQWLVPGTPESRENLRLQLAQAEALGWYQDLETGKVYRYHEEEPPAQEGDPPDPADH